MDLLHDVRGFSRAAGDIQPNRHTIVVVDTCTLFREGLVKILQASCFDVLASAENIADVLAHVDQGSTQAIDLLICSLDPQRGIEPQLAAIRAMRTRDARTKTVLLMPSCTAEDLLAALMCGVDGVVLKDISGEKLNAVLDLIIHGQHVLPVGIALQVFRDLRPAFAEVDQRQGREPAREAELATLRQAGLLPAQEAAAPAAAAAQPSVFESADAAGLRERSHQKTTRGLGLSERETQILQCLIEGYANKLIARRLDIAEATVKVHIKGLLRKINVSNRTQAAIWALNQSFTAQQTHAEPPRDRDGRPAHSFAQRVSVPDDPLLSDVVAVLTPVINSVAAHTHN